MGSPLSPVLADLFMEEFELDTIENADLRPSLWLRYVDDTFVVWPHGRTALQDFLTHLNNQHPLIKFTMETEQNQTISFLDVQVTRKADGTLAHTVHRKPTHTDRYLHSSSFHHPRFKSAVQNTLVRRAFNTCDQHSLKQELHHIKTSLQLNGYKKFNLIQPKPSLPPEERPEYKSTITLPYIGHTSHKLQRIFNQAQVKMFHTAPNKIQAALHTHKRTNKIHKTRLVFTAFPANAVKYTSVRPAATFLQESKNIEHTAD